MCGSMVDIQSPTSEIRRGKKIKKEEITGRKYIWPALLHRAAINKCSAVAEMGDPLATIHMGRKGEGCCVPFGRGAGSPSNTTSPGPRPTSVPSGILIHPAIWPQQTCAENWVAVPLLGGGWCPCKTMWLGPRHTSTPSFILTYLAKIHHCYRHHRQTDRQTDRQENG